MPPMIFGYLHSLKIRERTSLNKSTLLNDHSATSHSSSPEVTLVRPSLLTCILNGRHMLPWNQIMFLYVVADQSFWLWLCWLQKSQLQRVHGLPGTQVQHHFTTNLHSQWRKIISLSSRKSLGQVLSCWSHLRYTFQFLRCLLDVWGDALQIPESM